MTLQDANKLLGIAKANYSYAFKSMTQQEKLLLVQSWAFALQDIPADIVLLAFMQLLTTSKWLPTVAEIREQVRDLYYEAAYESLDDDTMALLGSRTSAQAANARQYILDCTHQLRGDGAPKLKLDTILRGQSYGFLGGGAMRLQGQSGPECLPEGDEYE